MESKMQRYGATSTVRAHTMEKRGPGIPPFLGTARQASPNWPLARHLVDRRGPRVGMTRTVRLSDLAIRWFELCTQLGRGSGQSVIAPPEPLLHLLAYQAMSPILRRPHEARRLAARSTANALRFARLSLAAIGLHIVPNA